MPDPTKGAAQARDPKEIEFFGKLIQSQQRIKMIGDQPVTIVNLNPYDLVVNHPLFDKIKVKAVQDGHDYSAHVINEVDYQISLGIDKDKTPIEFWPVQIAQEFNTQYAEKGGVFFIKGDLKKNPELERTEEFQTLKAKAREQLFVWCMKMKREADNEWNSPNRQGARNIHSPHRLAAKILVAHKRLAKLPEWMDLMPQADDIVPDCPICMAEQKKKGAILCASCGYVLDPFNGFKRGIVKETDMALERLTRAQVDELGVSAFVAETVDEAPKRLVAGKPKPQSKFEKQQQTALDKENPAKDGK